MGEEQQQHQRNRRRFTEEFKRDAVNLVRTTGRPIMERDLLKRTVAFWVKERSTPVVAGSDVRVDAGEGAGHAC